MCEKESECVRMPVWVGARVLAYINIWYMYYIEIVSLVLCARIPIWKMVFNIRYYIVRW